MTKDNILFAVIGLLAGLIIGFLGANQINRKAAEQGPVTASNSAAPGQNLPPDHPPVGSTGNSSQAQPSGGGALPQVTEALERARQQPENFEAQMTAADLYYQIQRFDDARKFYEAANKLKPAETEPLVKLGNVNFDLKKFEEAERWYNAALKKDPKQVSVRTDYGLTFFLREPPDVDRAISEYQTSLGIDPNHEITLQNLVVAYREKGDVENARKTIERLAKVNPDNPAVKAAAGQ
jgi:tetratricopeptide (TPR) repeat protein